MKIQTASLACQIIGLLALYDPHSTPLIRLLGHGLLNVNMDDYLVTAGTDILYLEINLLVTIIESYCLQNLNFL